MEDTTPVPTISPKLRTRLYVAGAMLGLGIAPALAAAAMTWPVAAIPAALAAGLSGACNALAFGYRPTLTT